MGMKPNDGGPAFPTSGMPGKFVDAGCGDRYTTADKPGQQGMTLRDYFAAAALQGAVACGANPNADLRTWPQEETLAAACFKIADAMLLARVQSPNQGA